MEEKKKRVRLYALSTCPQCKQVKEFLSKKNIGYELIEVDLLDSGEQWLTSKELKKYDPVVAYPTVIIEEFIKGYNEEALKEAFGQQ